MSKRNREEFSSALSPFRPSVPQNNPQLQATSHIHTAGLFLNRNNYTEAINSLDKALRNIASIVRTSDTLFLEISTKMLLADTYTKLAQQKMNSLPTFNMVSGDNSFHEAKIIVYKEAASNYQYAIFTVKYAKNSIDNYKDTLNKLGTLDQFFALDNNLKAIYGDYIKNLNDIHKGILEEFLAMDDYWKATSHIDMAILDLKDVSSIDRASYVEKLVSSCVDYVMKQPAYPETTNNLKLAIDLLRNNKVSEDAVSLYVKKLADTYYSLAKHHSGYDGDNTGHGVNHHQFIVGLLENSTQRLLNDDPLKMVAIIELAREYNNLAEKQLKLEAYEEGISALQCAVSQLLSFAVSTLPGVDELRGIYNESLAKACNEWGKKQTEAKDYIKAIKSLKEAVLALPEGNELKSIYKEDLAKACNEWGKKHTAAKDYISGVESLKEAVLALPEGSKLKSIYKEDLVKAYDGWGEKQTEAKNYMDRIENLKKAILALPADNELEIIYQEILDKACNIPEAMTGRGIISSAREIILRLENSSKSSPEQENAALKESMEAYETCGNFLLMSRNYNQALPNFESARNLGNQLKINNTNPSRTEFPSTLAALQASNNTKFFSSEINRIKALEQLQLLSEDQKLKYSQQISTRESILSGIDKFKALKSVKLQTLDQTNALRSDLSINTLCSVYAYNKMANILFDNNKQEAKNYYMKCLELIYPHTYESIAARPFDKLLNVIQTYIEDKMMLVISRPINPEVKFYQLQLYPSLQRIKYENLLKIMQIQLEGLKTAFQEKNLLDLSNHYHSLAGTFYSLSLEDEANADVYIEKSAKYFSLSGREPSLLMHKDVYQLSLLSVSQLFSQRYKAQDTYDLYSELVLYELYRHHGNFIESLKHLNNAEKLYPKLYIELKICGSSVISDIIFDYCTGDYKWCEEIHQREKLLPIIEAVEKEIFLTGVDDPEHTQ